MKLKTTKQTTEREFLTKVRAKINLAIDPQKLLRKISGLVTEYLDVTEFGFYSTASDALDTNERNGLNKTKARKNNYINDLDLNVYSQDIQKSLLHGSLVIVNGNNKTDNSAFIIVPILRNSKLIGAVKCSSNETRRWKDQEINLVENIAERTWNAYEHICSVKDTKEDLNVIDEGYILLNAAPDKENKELKVEFLEASESAVTGGMLELVQNNVLNKSTQLKLDLLEIIARVSADGKSERHQVHVKKYNSWFRFYISKTGKKESSPISIIYYDVSHLIEHEELLRQNEEMLHGLVESAPFGIYIIDSDFKLRVVNTGASAVFKEIDPLIGRDFEEIISIIWPKPLAGEFVSHFRHTLETGEPYIAPPVTSIRNNIDKTESYDWRLRRILMPDGRFGVVCYFYDLTQRIEIETALAESENRFRMAQTAGKVGVWDWDIPNNKIYWSEALWEFYDEVPSDTTLNDTYWSDRIYSKDKKRVIDNLEKTILSDSLNYRDTFRILSKKGEIRWVESIATIFRSDSKAALRMYGVCLDITDKVKVDDRLRKSEKQLQLITDNIPALVSYINSDRRYDFVNALYCQWFQLSKEDIIGKKVKSILGRNAYEKIRPYLDEALSGTAIDFETEVNYKTVGKMYIKGSYVPDIGSEGNVKGCYVLINDLTELKRSDDLLKATQQRIEILAESITDYAIFSTDLDGKIDSWNSGGTNLFGYSNDEIIGQTSKILFTTEDNEKEVPAKLMRNAGKKGRSSYERWLVRKDGTRFFANGVLAPLYDGKILSGFSKIVVDLTDKRRNDDALQRVHDEMEVRIGERTSELAEMNHILQDEISNRKTAEGIRIVLLQQLITGQEDERRRIARDIHDHLGQRLTALRLKIASLRKACKEDPTLYTRATRLQEISEVLDSEIGFLIWELRPTALDELGLTEAIDNYVTEWSKHYDISADFLSTGMSNVRLDADSETHLYRIAQEALNNIVKHSEAKNISVFLEKNEENFILIVEDDGVGFNSESMQNGSKQNKSFGLQGMKERAALMGAVFEIESSPGQGTTIFVRIPLSNINKMVIQ